MKNIVIVGTGTGASANDTNGGMYESPATWTTFQGVNGAPLDSLSSIALTNNGAAFVRASGAFTNAVVGAYVYLVDGVVYTTGRYKITAVNTGVSIDLDIAYTSDSTASSLIVGGALLTLDYPRTASLYADGDVLKVSNAVVYSTANANSAILETGHTPSSTLYAKYKNAIHCLGVDATTGEADYPNPVELNASGTSIGIKLNFTTIYENFDAYGGSGVGFDGAGGLDNFSLRKCHIHGFGGGGITGDDACEVWNCHIYDNTGVGINLDNASYIGYCNVYGNSGWGINFDGGYFCGYNKVYNNGGTYQVYGNYGIFVGNEIQNDSGFLIGMDEQNQQPFILAQNTLDGMNGASVIGIKGWTVTNPGTYINILNNIVIRCNEGIVIPKDMNGNEQIDGNNLYGNTTDYSTELVNVTNNKNTDPGLNDVSTQDLRLNYNSSAREDAEDASKIGGSSSERDIGAGNSIPNTASGGSTSSSTSSINQSLKILRI